MKPLTKTANWPKLAVFDIEAEQWVNVTLLCHVDEYGNRKSFDSVKAYLDWLFEDSPVDHVWAHWGGRYDHRFIIAEATKRGWEWETIQSGNSIIIVSVFHLNREIRFCESARLMPDSVKKIGKTVGLEKIEVDRSHIERLTKQEAIDYCFRDCDIVLKGLQYMRDALTEVGADFAYTLASIASRWVRHSGVVDWKRFYRRLGKKWVYRKDMLAADDFCMPAYMGGRTEVFKTSIREPNRVFKGPLYYYDVRSSYPWSMTFDLPLYLKGFKLPNDRVDRALAHCGVSEATVTVPSNTYLPILGLRHDSRLVFPVGLMRSRWTNIELEEARKRGAKVEIHTQCLFEPLPFLRNFVETFYRLRKKAIEDNDSFRSYTYKIALNSLYGKLVESVERTATIFGTNRIKEALDKGLKVSPTNTPGVYAVKGEKQGPFRHVAAGAYVTARSRLLLHSYLEQALELGGLVYYCDTDSIITNVQLPESTDALGNLKLEYTFSELEIVSPKVYRGITTEGKEIYKAKGVPIHGTDSDGKERGPDECRKRWESYTTGIQIEKEGVSGFASDIKAGVVDPRARMEGSELGPLKRALRNHDKKRTHEGPNSLPLRVENGN